jgi:hypothetical protein
MKKLLLILILLSMSTLSYAEESSCCDANLMLHDKVVSVCTGSVSSNAATCTMDGEEYNGPLPVCTSTLTPGEQRWIAPRGYSIQCQ